MSMLENFDERQLRAIEYLSQPKRGGFTYEEIAEKVGVTSKTLMRWRDKPDFKKAITERALANIRDELPDVFKAHVQIAKGGNIKAIELLYKVSGLMIERQEITQTIDDKRDTDSIERDIAELGRLLDDDIEVE